MPGFFPRPVNTSVSIKANLLEEISTHRSIQCDLPVSLRRNWDGCERAGVSALVTATQCELAVLRGPGLLSTEIEAEFLGADFALLDEIEEERQLKGDRSVSGRVC